jgi:hypothetical protein
LKVTDTGRVERVKTYPKFKKYMNRQDLKCTDTGRVERVQPKEDHGAIRLLISLYQLLEGQGKCGVRIPSARIPPSSTSSDQENYTFFISGTSKL